MIAGIGNLFSLIKLSITYLTAYLSNATLTSPLLLGPHYIEQNTLKIHFAHIGLVKGTN